MHTVKGVMTTEVVTVGAKASFKDIVERMHRQHVSTLPVVGPAGQVLGVVSKSDLLLKPAHPDAEEEFHLTPGGRRRQRKASGTIACELMTSPAITVPDTAGVDDALRVMRRHGVSRLPVVDASTGCWGRLRLGAAAAGSLLICIRSPLLEWKGSLMSDGGTGEVPGGRAESGTGRLSGTGRPIPEHLDEAECLRLISPSGVGRLAYNGRFGPTVLPVNYVLHEGTIVFRTAHDSPTDEDLRTGIAGAEYKVAFEIDNLVPTAQQGWSVLVQGSAHHVESESERASVLAAGVEPWAGGVRELFVRILPTRITGRRISTSPTSRRSQ